MPQAGDSSPSSDFKGLLAVLLAVLLMAFLTSGHRECPRESIRILRHVIQLLGNSSDAQLYTPGNFTEACFAADLDCFQRELEVIAREEEEHEAVLRSLIGRLGKMQPKNCTDPRGRCQPCECHRERAVPVFLRTLQRMLQWGCVNQVAPCAAKRRKGCGPPR